MNYYRLMYSEFDDIKNFIMISDYNLKGFDYRKLWKGQIIDNWKNDIELFYEHEGEVLDYTPNVLSWLILSDKVIKVFDKMKIKQFQSFSVKLVKKIGNREIKFSNVVNLVCDKSVLNWEKSDLITWDDDPKYIKAIRNLVMDSLKLEGLPDIFRLSESKNYIIVSEKFKNNIEREGVTGFQFLRLSQE